MFASSASVVSVFASVVVSTASVVSVFASVLVLAGKFLAGKLLCFYWPRT
jgi:hypothetical protein